MRLTLAVLVLVDHSFFLAARAPDPLSRLTHGAIDLGGIAVDGFFVLSGFLIASSWAGSRTAWTYLKKRAARIYPGFAGVWLAMAIMLPMLIAHRFTVNPIQLLKVPIHVGLLQQIAYPGTFAHNPYPGEANGSLWTIGYEFRCYLLLPLLGVLGVNRRRWLSLAVLLAALIAVPCVPSNLAWRTAGIGKLVCLDAGPWPRLLACFAAGTAFYAYRESIPRSEWLAVASLAVLIASARSPVGVKLAVPIAGTYLLFWIAYAPLGLSGFGRYGDWSYGVYLWAFFIQQILVERFAGITPGRLLLLSLPLSLLAGCLSWHLIEKRFLRRAHSRRPAVQSA